MLPDVHGSIGARESERFLQWVDLYGVAMGRCIMELRQAYEGVYRLLWIGGETMRNRGVYRYKTHLLAPHFREPCPVWGHFHRSVDGRDFWHGRSNLEQIYGKSSYVIEI